MVYQSQVIIIIVDIIFLHVSMLLQKYIIIFLIAGTMHMGGVPIREDALILGCLYSYRSRKVPCRSIWSLRMYVNYGITSQIAVLEPVMTMRITKKSSTLVPGKTKALLGLSLYTIVRSLRLLSSGFCPKNLIIQCHSV